MLHILAKHHDLWISYVLSFKVNEDTAKDIVQEFYLKMSNFTGDIMIGEKINFYFVYLVLRNMVFDLKKKEKTITFLEIPPDRPDKWTDKYVSAKYSGQEKNHKDYDKSKSLYITQWLKDHNLEELDLFDGENIKEAYSAVIFNEIILEKKSIAQLSRETKISYYSLYNTVRTIKNEIKESYEAWNKTRKDI